MPLVDPGGLAADGWGLCVWHTGVRREAVATIRFRGLLSTTSQFGCPSWEKDERKKVAG